MKSLVISSVILSLLLQVQTTTSESGDLFTAQVELESLIVTEQSVIEAFEIYLSKEQIRLDEIRRRLVPYVEHARQSPPEVVSNPINAFLLLKELSVDLDDLISLSDYRTNAVGKLPLHGLYPLP